MANSINSVVLVGNLTRNAEVKVTPKGSYIINFSVALNRSRKDGEKWVDEVSYINITHFSKNPNLGRYLTKGKQIGIDGEIRQDRWEKDNQTQSKVYVVANNIQLLGGTGNTTTPHTEKHSTSQSESEGDYGSFQGDNIDDDDEIIPF